MIEIKLSFATIQDAHAFLNGAVQAVQGPVTLQVSEAAPKPAPKPAKPAASPAASQPTATEAPAPVAQEPKAPVTPTIDYAPISAAITALVKAGHGPKLAEFFKTLKKTDGTTGVKKGSEVHADDLPKLRDGVAKIQAEVESSEDMG